MNQTIPFILIASAFIGLLTVGPSAQSFALAVSQTKQVPTDEAAQSREDRRLRSLERSAARILGLFDCQVVRIEVRGSVGTAVTLDLPIDGKILPVRLVPHSVRSENQFEVLAQLADGSLVNQTSEEVRTYRGSVESVPGSVAAASLLEDGLYLSVIMPGRERWWLEPIQTRLPNAEPDEYALYRHSDIIGTTGKCGVTDEWLAQNHMPHDEDAHAPEEPGRAVFKCAELACDADFEYYVSRGSSVANVQNRIEQVINQMNLQYEEDVLITHSITTIIVRTAEPDPYSSTNASTLLGQFRSHWLANHGSIQRDVAQLFTAKSIDGSTIGIAWTIGGICTSSAYCLVQSDCCGSLGCATDLSAHELGHLWGGGHCDPCSETMRSFIGCFNNFTTPSINSITAHANSRTCLDLCDSSEFAMTPLPFFDSFPSTVIDTSKWTGNNGATVDGVGIGEPSPPFSLRINGSDQIRSARMDTSQVASATLRYWWQRTGGGNSPEPGEDLKVEYLNDALNWTVIATHPAVGSHTDPYQLAQFALPADAHHGGFRLRFRGTSPNNGADDYFIDDVEVIIPPSNDICSSAILFTTNSIAVTNVAASNSIGLAESCGNLESDVWFRYLNSCHGTLTFSICDANFDTQLAVYGPGCPSSPGSIIACNDDSCGTGSSVTFNASPGVFRIRIGGKAGSQGSGTLTVSCTPLPTGACCHSDGSCVVISNDDCSLAGGTYQGDSSSCTPNSCPQPTGACCYQNGSCTDTITQVDCDTAGGVYQGDAVLCSFVSCPSPCPEDIIPPGGDGQVTIADITAVLSAFGLTCNGCPEDVVPPGGDGQVTIADINAVIAAFGPCN